jgi:hypothetical protein
MHVLFSRSCQELNIQKIEAERNKREQARIQQIKSSKERHNLRATSHHGIRSRNDVIRRLDQIAPNRVILREMIKYKRRIEAMNSKNHNVKISLDDLQQVRTEIITDKIRLFGTSA